MKRTRTYHRNNGRRLWNRRYGKSNRWHYTIISKRKLVDRKMQILTLLEEQSENVEKKELEKELIEIVNQLARMK